MSFLSSIRQLFTGFDSKPIGPAERAAGRPPSGNGASSFHLWWETPPGTIVELAVTVEVRTPPKVDALHFFALQASFVDKGVETGGAHVGLQWNPRFPGSRAVNWGGYDAAGSILAGTESPLTSTPDDPNTRDYPWQPQQRYRLKIGPAAPTEHAVLWPGRVTDLGSGETVIVRHLVASGRELARPVIWSEVFAACDAPSVEVRWTDLSVTTSDGIFAVPSCTTAYQRYEMGGCTNTNSTVDHNAFVQITNTPRTNAAGSTLDL